MTIYNTDEITESEAIRLYFDLSRRFGWQGAFFTREDAENSWNEYHEQTSPFTDEVWDAVRRSFYWRKALADALIERGWGLIHEAVQEALNDYEDTLSDR